jgi:putative transposase
VALVMKEKRFSERRACKLLGVDRATYRHQPEPDRNALLREELIALARQRPRYGYRRLAELLRRRGLPVNDKRVYRLYRQERLTVRRIKRKHVTRPTLPLASLSGPNQEWSMDFVMDGLTTGRGLRLLTVVDSFTRECLAIEVDSCLSGERVTRVLERVANERGVPQAVRCDNGPEFTSRAFLGWLEQRKIAANHIQPGRPMQNGYIESFNGRLRDECLNANAFPTMADARAKVEHFRRDYNGERPHSALGYRTPNEFAAVFAPSPRRPSLPPDARPVQAALTGALRAVWTGLRSGDRFHDRGEGAT